MIIGPLCDLFPHHFCFLLLYEHTFVKFIQRMIYLLSCRRSCSHWRNSPHRSFSRPRRRRRASWRRRPTCRWCCRGWEMQKHQEGAGNARVSFADSSLSFTFLQEKENLNNLERKYGELTGGRSFPINPLSMKEVRCDITCQSNLPGSKYFSNKDTKEPKDTPSAKRKRLILCKWHAAAWPIRFNHMSFFIYLKCLQVIIC